MRSSTLLRGSILFTVIGLVVACTRAVPPQAKGEVDGPVDCQPAQFKAREVCFDKAQLACDSLACPHGCDILRSRTSKSVSCSASEVSSSKLTRCRGIANWQCPENTVCIDDPKGTCKDATDDDCIGVCVPAP
jgi:hypothetical protein